MYKQFFGLREEPFNMTPDPHFLYFSKRHMELLSCLHYGVQWRKGFIEITGEIGAGKTTVCRLFLETIKHKAKTALILNPTLSESQLLQTIVDDFGIAVKGRTKKAYFDAINTFLLDALAEGSNAVLIIDEAQNLSPRTLEQIRLLSNLETEKHKLIQIVLVGQPELRDLLRSPSLVQLRQRISVRYHLMPLDYTETEAYIYHRLKCAGCPEEEVIFTTHALANIYEYSKGVPRLINVVCDKILLAAYVRGTKKIIYQIVEEAVREIEGYVSSEVPVSEIEELQSLHLPGSEEGLTV